MSILHYVALALTVFLSIGQSTTPNIGIPPVGHVLLIEYQNALSKTQFLDSERQSEYIDRERVDPGTDSRILGLRQTPADWFARSVGGARLAEIWTKDGVITSVRLHYERLRNDRANRLVDDLAEVGQLTITLGLPEQHLCEGYVEVDGIRVRFTLIRAAHYSSVQGRVIAGEAIDKGEATLEFAIDPVELSILESGDGLDNRVRDAMRSGELIIGMSEEQARATPVRFHEAEVPAEIGRDKQIVWYRPFDRGRSRKIAFIGYFEDGILQSVERY